MRHHIGAAIVLGVVAAAAMLGEAPAAGQTRQGGPAQAG
jgi:hypothetical protein